MGTFLYLSHRARALRLGARVTIVVTLVFGSLATAELAWSATVRFVPETRDTFALMIFEANTGEANELTITLAEDLSWVFRDAGAPVTPAGGCTSVDAQTASCPWPGEYFVLLVRLGDEDDSVSAAGVCPDCTIEDFAWPPMEFSGSAGADTLIAADGGTELVGGEGPDVLRGGGDHDVLHGGPGADTIDGGGDGASGDTVSYAGHREAVRVDMDADPIEGAAGENDNVVNVENAVGGAGDDWLIGDRGRNDLFGGPGRDVLLGHGSGDRISGGRGADVIRGGRGRDDWLEGEEGDDWISGGPGADAISGDHSEGGQRFDRGGDDTVFGGAGDDYLSGWGGSDRLFGGDGRDSIAGHGGRDLLDGGRGRDALFPAGTEGTIFGEPDRLGVSRDGAADRVRGGPDRDEAWVERRDRVSAVEQLHVFGAGATLAGRRRGERRNFK